jgi:cytochrome b561
VYFALHSTVDEMEVSTKIIVAQHYTFINRFLHWGIAIIMTFILLTILLRLGWLNKFHLAEILNENLRARGIVLPEEELIVVAKKIRKPMWNWHIYSGYALTVLYTLRILYNVFSKRFKGSAVAAMRRESRGSLQSLTYLVFYLFVFVSLATGLLIENGPKAWKGTLEGIHEWSLWYLVAFIALHFIGLALSEKAGEGKVRAMFFSAPNKF